MQKKLGVGAFAAWVAIAGLIACTSDTETTSPSTTPDASSPADSSTSNDSSSSSDSSTTTDSPSDSASGCNPYTAAAPSTSGAPQCHDLANDAPEIGTTADPGTIPTGTGGTIADGRYFLTEVRLYAGSPIASGYKFQQTYVIKGGKIYIIERTNTGTSNETFRKIKSLLVDGGESTDCTSDVTHVDPPGQSLTATCDKVIVYTSQYGFSSTLTRQP